MQLNHQARTNILASLIAGVMILSFSVPAFADDSAGGKVDAEAAEKLARKDKCLRCHGVTKQKEGPSFKSIADKYRGDNEAAEKILKHITEGKDVANFPDGHKELHKYDKKHNLDQLQNLVNWILSR